MTQAMSSHSFENTYFKLNAFSVCWACVLSLEQKECPLGTWSFCVHVTPVWLMALVLANPSRKALPPPVGSFGAEVFSADVFCLVFGSLLPSAAFSQCWSGRCGIGSLVLSLRAEIMDSEVAQARRRL